MNQTHAAAHDRLRYFAADRPPQSLTCEDAEVNGHRVALIIAPSARGQVYVIVVARE